jgi:hypothetical protein
MIFFRHDISSNCAFRPFMPEFGSNVLLDEIIVSGQAGAKPMFCTTLICKYLNYPFTVNPHCQRLIGFSVHQTARFPADIHPRIYKEDPQRKLRIRQTRPKIP